MLFVSGIHGDEYAAVSVTFKWMQILKEYHSGLFHWRFAPLMNPDGLLNKKSQRTNANGVDLNRNFPTTNWNRALVDYWEVRTGKNKRRYPGPHALSEPESRWLFTEIASFRPDVVISVHAPHGIVDFDGPEKVAPKKLGNLNLKLLGTYPGSLGNYANVYGGMPVVTLELPHAGIMPSKKHIDRIWTDLVKWLRNKIEWKASEPIMQASING
ncbi:MAG: M14 family zinc carboxypeptidase [Gammaproteobacteria bacterium]|nr:M14 family zinc carboxypeptidase [Gammaproteobacteria bacterium]